MRHPEHEVGDRRVCPLTDRLFGECWTELEPFDSCANCSSAIRLQTIAERLSALNEQRRRAAEHSKGDLS